MSRRIEKGEDGERQAESGIPPSDHYERHVKRGQETEALTWASPHRERERRGGRRDKGSRNKRSRGINRNVDVRNGREERDCEGWRKKPRKENNERERACGIMRQGRWREGEGGERALLATSHRSGTVRLATPPLTSSQPCFAP